MHEKHKLGFSFFSALLVYALDVKSGPWYSVPGLPFARVAFSSGAASILPCMQVGILDVMQPL